VEFAPKCDCGKTLREISLNRDGIFRFPFPTRLLLRTPPDRDTGPALHPRRLHLKGAPPASPRLTIQRSKLPKRAKLRTRQSLSSCSAQIRPSQLEDMIRPQYTLAILGAMPDRATDPCYASNTLLKASPLFGTIIGCFLMKSAFVTSLV
jgi:hypothetical protein